MLHQIVAELFGTEGFMPRRLCGLWTTDLMLLHMVSDFVIWCSYMYIPFLLRWAWGLYRAGRLDIGQVRRSARPMVGMFVAFILCCGITHLHQIVVFYWPCYRWIGLWSALTACCSAIAMVALSMILGAAVRPQGWRKEWAGAGAGADTPTKGMEMESGGTDG